MAVTQNTLIGRTRGSIGGVTFSKWKGLNVAKGKAENVQQPNTDAQLLQRDKMTLIVGLYRSISSIVQTGFRSLAVNMSEFNAFTSYNIKNAVQALNATDAELVFADILIAKGALSSTPVTGMSGASAQADVALTYSASLAAPDQSLLDLALAVVINETQGIIAFVGGADNRSDGTTSVSMSENLVSGDVIHGYLFFENEAGTEVSDSTYFTYTVA